MEQARLMSIIESVLFISGEPIKKNSLKKILPEENSADDIEKALEALSEKYSASQSGLMLMKKDDEVQLVSNPENAPFVEKIVKSELQDSLSNAALETISIIAYRGPISKTDIEMIRGVNCAYTLRNLLLKGLVERNNNPKDSRGYVYSISFEFLKKLGIDDVKKLPEYDKLSVDERIKNLV